MFLCMGSVGDVSLAGHRGIPRGRIWNNRPVWSAVLWEMWLRGTDLGVLMGLCIFCCCCGDWGRLSEWLCDCVSCFMVLEGGQGCGGCLWELRVFPLWSLLAVPEGPRA